MPRKIILSLVVLLLGVGLLYSGIQAWKEEPERSFVPGKATILQHELTFDKVRWESEDDSLRVKTTFSSDHSSENAADSTVRFFKNEKDAWEFIGEKTVGSDQEILFSRDGERAAWPSGWGSKPQIHILMGIVLLAGLILQWTSSGDFTPLHLIAWIALFVAFPGVGIVGAKKIWPSMVTQVNAVSWDLVPYEVLGFRSVSSGKSQSHEMAVRYDYGGKTYFAVRSAIEDDEPPASGAPGLRWCRVNPLQPWQLETIWGWTPSLGMGLFPVPFLAVGVAAWLFGLRWLLQKSRGQSPSLESLGNMGQIAGQLLAMLFIGPIVGVFVSICAEMWSSQSGMSWFLALFLTPFVCVVLMTGWHLCKSLWHVLTGKVGPIPLPKSKFRRGW